jgi:hypothetical protein
MYEPDFRPAHAVSTLRSRGFWRRQFGAQVTPKQRRFDITFGFVMPVLCFVFDPIVFHRWLSYEPGLLGRWQFYAYTISALEMVALAVWLFKAGGGGRPPAALGGMLLAGGVFSLVVGVVLLPFSLLGLIFFFVGVFGFTPFCTAVVYLRNGWRAANPGRSGDGLRAGAAAAFALGFVLALGAPALAKFYAEMTSGETTGVEVERRRSPFLD